MSSKNKFITDLNTVKRQLSGRGVLLDLGPICTRISIKFPSIRDEFLKIYADYPFIEDPAVIDYYLDVYARNFYRQYIRPQVAINTLLRNNFVPLPESMGLLSLLSRLSNE